MTKGSQEPNPAYPLETMVQCSLTQCSQRLYIEHNYHEKMRLDCTSSEQNITIYNRSKNLNLTKYVQDAYTENYKPLMKKIKDNLNK